MLHIMRRSSGAESSSTPMTHRRQSSGYVTYLKVKTFICRALEEEQAPLLRVGTGCQKRRERRRGAILRTRNQNDTLVKLYSEDELSFVRDLDYFRISKIPTAGRYIREELIEERQLSLEETVL